MSTVQDRVHDFLAQRHIAVAGVSRDPKQVANLLFRRLRDSGHQVIPINPQASQVEGVPCYPDLAAAPPPIDAVMIATPAEAALDVVKQCTALGISRVWMHRAFGPGSVSVPAVQHCREHGIRAIVGGCPMMFCAPVDVFHRCMRWVVGIQAPATH